MKGKKYRTESAFKWPKHKDAYMEWWNGLTIEQKVEEKRLFELKRIENQKRHLPYPDMKDLTGLRLSQLSDKHIYRIWVFRDHKVAGFSKA
jgi:hypothetical protein